MVDMNPERYPSRQSADQTLYNNVEYVVFDKFDTDISMSYKVHVHWTRVFDYMDKSKGYGGDVIGVVWSDSLNEYDGLRRKFSYGGMLSDSKTGQAVAIYVGTGGTRNVRLRRKDIETV